MKRRNCTRSTSHSTMPTAIGTMKWQKYTTVQAIASQCSEPKWACSHWLRSVPPNKALSLPLNTTPGLPFA